MISINHVMSNDVSSGIFNDFLGYFKKIGLTQGFRHIDSIRPLDGVLIRHYHRPNLEANLINPCVVTVHHDLSETDEWLVFSNYEKQYRQADALVCLCYQQKKFLEGRGFTNVIVIPHGYNAKFLSRPPSIRKLVGTRKVTLGIISRRYPRKVKGEALFHELLKRLAPDTVRFLLIGQDRGEDHVYLDRLGFEYESYDSVPYPVLCNAYHEMDALLVLSSHEGGPANVPEALVTHTPILSTKIGMCLDYVTHGQNGMFLTGNPDKDAEVIGSFCSNKNNLADALMAGAANPRRLPWTWEEVVREYSRVYHEIIAVLMSGGSGSGWHTEGRADA
ncbi:MAG: glycosyltransferase [Desulfobacter sp.]